MPLHDEPQRARRWLERLTGELWRPGEVALGVVGREQLTCRLGRRLGLAPSLACICSAALHHTADFPTAAAISLSRI